MTDMIRQFLRLESAGGILLIIASAVAMLLANTSLEGIYDQFLALP
ncbi:MAG: Na+/H+ antiporter NhaA, partial [Plesiomonas shigelloides]